MSADRGNSIIRDVARTLALDFIPELVDLLAVGRRHRLPARCGDAWLLPGRARLPLIAVGWAHPVLDRFWRNLLIAGVILNMAEAIAGESLWHVWAAMVVACAWLWLT